MLLIITSDIVYCLINIFSSGRLDYLPSYLLPVVAKLIPSSYYLELGLLLMRRTVYVTECSCAYECVCVRRMISPHTYTHILHMVILLLTLSVASTEAPAPSSNLTVSALPRRAANKEGGQFKAWGLFFST